MNETADVGLALIQLLLLVALAPTHFYILLATFVLQLNILRLTSGSTTVEALNSFVRNCPTLLRDWLKEVLAIRTFSHPNR